jgi:hypothetical protein
MLPRPESDPPELRPPPEAATTPCRNRRAPPSPVSAQQLSSASGRVRGVSPRAVTHRSGSIPRAPAQRYRERECPLSAAVMVSALAVTAVRASSSPGNTGKPRRPWPELGRTVPDGDRAMTVYGWAGSGEGSRWLRSPLAGPVVHRYWLVAALSVFDTRTDTTLARLMITPFSSASRSYFACVKTRPRRSSSA